MSRTARDEILDTLRQTRDIEAPARPDLPPARELSLSKEELIQKFTTLLEAEAGVVHRVDSREAALSKLTEVLKTKGITRIMASSDPFLAGMDLPGWGRNQSIEIMTTDFFETRTDYKDAAFNRVQAGLTGADYLVAETGTIVLAHDAGQARLISLAPMTHIVLAPSDRLVPIHERVVGEIFSKAQIPSQVCFITGPSMTGDIEGQLCKGMHGPQKVIVILIDLKKT